MLDDVWGFDPSVFGISPREAEQMDPQQRILLQLTWEALEDAGIPPSSLAGSETGVFIGGSQTDYAHSMFADYAIADGHFATGNALAILANRVSYIFDLRGPSVTIDTACSSSLVALHQACEALRSGRIDTAIVGGVNVIASAAEFISFSQASMLSPTGLCHAFSADADGYVRAEGGAVLVLRKASHAAESLNRVHSVILASDVNSDGRTNGISLPSATTQAALLARVYSHAGIDPNRLAFVEAHGTGTPVGDPVEASALGQTLGAARSQPLPIGSVKTNVGHTEAASGLTGLLKAALSLERGVFPRSLHSDTLNPAIPFNELNLSVCTRPLILSKEDDCCAGVNSFGFGGTNAHVVIAPGTEGFRRTANWRPPNGGGFFALSAATKPALTALAQDYAERLNGLSDAETAKVASAIANHRDHLSSRAIVSTTRSQDVREALNAFVAGSDDPLLISGTAIGDALQVGFVYSGNGSQWAGMGMVAYRHNAAFRSQFDRIDEHFSELSGWSLKETLFDKSLSLRLHSTSVAQPLIFAIQSAGTAALRARGLRPVATIGHSVGEVAAAEAAGALDSRAAAEVIYFRSKHQEMLHGAGRMAAVRSSLEELEYTLAGAGSVEIAAINSPRSVTVAGSAAAVASLKTRAAGNGIALLDLGLDYPFHTAAMEPIHRPLLEDLRTLAPRDTATAFISTVTGSILPGSQLDASYWWRNVREPVQFLAGIREMVALGVRFFVEIGPRSTLLRHISDNPDVLSQQTAMLSLLDRNDKEGDPVERVISKAYVCGVALDSDKIFGPDPGVAVSLPSYPWQQRSFRFGSTQEAAGVAEAEHYPFSGVRNNADELVWRSNIDIALFPSLADHSVGEQTIFPGTGFLEIAFAVASEWLDTPHVLLTNFEILAPLELTNGATREIMARVSPTSSTIEIFSRLRLSRASWTQHCRAKIFHADARAVVAQPLHHSRTIDAEAVYRVASACGLEYGPAFRLLATARRGENTIEVDLTPGPAETAFMLDPVRLDACCHGLITVFSELHAQERGVSYLPVRLDEAMLIVPGAVPQRALIEVLSKDERAITANYTFFGAGGDIIAVLRGVHCQAAQIKRPANLETASFVELPQLIDGRIFGNTGLAIDVDAILRGAEARGLFPAVEAVPPDEAGPLVEGCAMAAAYEIASALADEAILDLDALIGNGRLLPELRSWLSGALTRLETVGLAEGDQDRWTIVSDPLFPSAASVLKELASEHPACAGELLLSGVFAGLAAHAAEHRAIISPPDLVLTPTVLDFYDLASSSLASASGKIFELLDHETVWPANRGVRVLQIGYGPLTQSLLTLQQRRGAMLTVLEPDRRRCDSARRMLAGIGNVVLADQQTVDGLGEFDLIVAVDSLYRLPATLGLDRLRQVLAPRGMLVGAELQPSVFRDMTVGLEAGSFSDAADQSAHRLRHPDEWLAALANAGFINTRTVSFSAGCGISSLILGEVAGGARERVAVQDNTPRHVAVIVDGATGAQARIAAELVNQFRQQGIGASITHSVKLPDPAPDTVVHFIDSGQSQLDSMELLTARCLEIKTCVERFGTTQATIWHVHRGALASGAAKADPFAAAIWAFSRTVANEFPALDVRRVDLASSLSANVMAGRLRDVILSGTAETEIQIEDASLRAVRVDRIKCVLDRLPPPHAQAIRLQRRLASSQRLQWEMVERTRPGPDEVEIEVEATGLNFRDLMWSLSLLPDDIVEGGVAGVTLGCECAGRIVQVGSGVSHLRKGDRVVALASAAFSTHVTIAAGCVAKLPDTISAEAGATIPVAFLTAYYSLVSQARLEDGEWVLIHGGAGGVGLAAAQIARACGARIIATAGSTAKRDLLTALGVDHVLDSRSNTFIEDVRAIVPEGVDVVLNSLAGEAMERGISCLRPFGRFVEIGKRDYVANTHIGLRPFRRNLTYFGVDIDQLMFARNDIGQKALANLMKQLESGALSPLPYTVFKAEAISEAFHVMQHSGHIGKIVVRPPGAELVSRPSKPFVASATGTHVITGAFGGFGWEAAKWLVDHGARHLVLLGRKGAATEEAKAGLAQLSRRGVNIYAEPCDVADRRAVERMFQHVHRTMPPVVGVLHAAMVLDDGLLLNLDEERFHRVLAPKVLGTDNLDRLTRGMPLEYFVLFSSATTLVGNPGQGNYVAANAYMEGIARRRRQEGLKALAIGWGPITDVGVLARSERLRARFQKLIGIRGMPARAALDLMARALEQPPSTNLAVMTISPTEGIFTADRLPVLASPTYANMVRGDQTEAGRLSHNVDLYALAKTEGVEAVRRALGDIIVAQLAHILHAREEDIPRLRPLAEIGVDSLMAIEVAMNLEEAVGIHMSLTSTIGNLTVGSLANELIAQMELGERDESVAKSLVEMHTEKAGVEQIAVLEGIVSEVVDSNSKRWVVH